MSGEGSHPPSSGHGAHGPERRPAGHGAHAGTHARRGRRIDERFAPGAGRPRPPHVPKAIRCASCGAPATLADERTRSHACAHCGAILDLTEAEQAVVGRQTGSFRYPIDLADSFRWRGTRWEVIARLTYLEDGDADEINRHYLLYNPRRGTRWLAEYLARYDLSEPTHVMPRTDPSRLLRGEDRTFETHDGRKWRVKERCDYTLAHVEGSLPWVARVGDRIRTLEAFRRGEPSELFEIEEAGSEIELAEGHRLPLARVRAAVGRPDLPGEPDWVREDRKRRVDAQWIGVIAVVAIIVNVVGWGLVSATGERALRQDFTASELSSEVLSDPFDVTEPDTTLALQLEAPIDNAWMSVDLALVGEENAVVHVDDAEIQYYHGRSGGESWSEGSRDETLHVRVPEPGRYRVLLHAVSAEGNTPRAREARHPLTLEVQEGALKPQFRLGFFAGIAGLIAAVVLGKGKE